MKNSVPKETTSTEMERYLSGPSIRTSIGLDWGPLTVRCRIEPSGAHHFCIPGTPDPWLVVTTAGAPRRIEVLGKSGWRSAFSGPGDLAITSPGTTTEVRWDSPNDGPIETVHVCIDAALFYGVVAEGANCDPQQVEIINSFSQADPLVEKIVCVLARELEYPRTASRLLAESAAQFLSVHLLRHYCAFSKAIKPERPVLSPRKIKEVTDYVEAHISTAISLNDLAYVAHVSVFHFARLFKAATGVTPHGFVIKRRIERAKAMLKGTDLSAAEVADAVGFSSTGHFAAAFRRYSGLTPIRFRSIYR